MENVRQKREVEVDKEVKEDGGKKEKKSGRQKKIKRLSRGSVCTQSGWRLDIFSHGEIAECDLCGADSDCESGTWSSAIVSSDILVLPSFAVEVLGDGEPSDSGWDLGSGVWLCRCVGCACGY